MSVSVQKTGVVVASGDIGANLLIKTGVQTYGTVNMAVYRSGTFAVDNTMLFNGKPTLKINPSSSSTTSGAYNTYDSSVLLKNGVTYCYSAWVYTDVADSWTSTSLGHFQTVADGTSHNRTILVENSVVSANTWTRVYIVFTPTADCQFRSYHIYFANTSQTLWISNLKLEVGDHPTFWIPNANDEDFVGSINGFNEYSGVAQIAEGSVNAPDFIEI